MFCGYEDVSVYSKSNYFAILPYIFRFIMSSLQGVRNGPSKVNFHSEAVGQRVQEPEDEGGFVLGKTLELYMGRCHTTSLGTKTQSSGQSPP